MAYVYHIDFFHYYPNYDVNFSFSFYFPFSLILPFFYSSFFHSFFIFFFFPSFFPTQHPLSLFIPFSHFLIFQFPIPITTTHLTTHKNKPHYIYFKKRQ